MRFDSILKNLNKKPCTRSQSKKSKSNNLAEAIHYRSLDRENWVNQG